jgi:hypothetical protein
MVSPMEKILGGPIGKKDKIPGTGSDEAERIRYVSFDGKKAPKKLFRAVTGRIEPLVPTEGTVMLEPCVITTPDGTHLYPLYFHGDIAGWQRQIEEGAKELGLVTAKIEDQALVLSDGRRFALGDCQAQFD